MTSQTALAQGGIDPTGPIVAHGDLISSRAPDAREPFRLMGSPAIRAG